MAKSTGSLGSNNGYVANEQAAEALEKPARLIVSGNFEASELRTVKCYQCYTYDVVAVCHHCGRFVCKRCLRVTSSRLFVDNVFAYLKPSLGMKLKRGAHCQDCFHQDLQVGPMLALPGLMFVILLLIVWSNLNGFQRTGLIGGIIILGLASAIVDRLLLRNVVYPIGQPLFSRLKVELQEWIEANFNIDGRPYLFPDPVATGAILITLGVSPNDRERQESVPSPEFPLKFHAGFVGLETLKNVRFMKSIGLRRRKNLLTLTSVINRDAFERRCRKSGDFCLVEPYRIQPEALQIGPPDNREFPLVIKARRADGGYRLEIILAIPVDLKLKFAKSRVEKRKNKKGDRPGLDGKPILNSLILHIPVGCEVESTNGHYEQQERVIRWYKSALDVKPGFSVFVRFKQIIPNNVVFRGEYSVTIKNWTISQLHVAPDVGAANKHLVRPVNGLRITTSNDEDKELEWLVPTVEHSTKIEGKLCINTTYLLSQQVQTESDLLADENTQTEITGQEKLLVAPTHHVVNAIIEALTNEKVFIKQVTEIPGQVTETDLGSRRARYWRIWGKYYLENALQPADLRLVISGDGSQNDHPNSEGHLILELNLRSYVGMGDLNTRDHLKDAYKKFRGLIKIAAYKGRQVDFQDRRILAWQLEEQFECDLQQSWCTEKVAVILTGGSNSKQGYAVSCHRDGQYQLPQHLNHLELWRYLGNRLPVVEIPGYKWVDKWELLRRVERRR